MSYKPEDVNTYKGRQIVLNSGRLVFNGREDSVLVFADKSILLASNGSVNIDSESHFIVNAPKIYLGVESKNEKEPLLLGDSTYKLLKTLLKKLSSFTQNLSSVKSTPMGTPILELNTASAQLKVSVDSLLKDIEKIKSKQNYTV